MGCETRYFDDDQHTINGLLAYKLDTSQSAGTTNCGGSGGASVTVYWGIRVWVRDSGGSENEVTAGTPVAQVSRSSNGQGLQSNTWNCPETALAVTDAVVVRVYHKEGIGGAWALCMSSITEQLGNTQLDGGVWTVWYYTFWSWNGGKVPVLIFQFEWGDATRNSRIENFCHSTPAAGAVLRRLLVGVGL